jgi:hypothetical protein
MHKLRTVAFAALFAAAVTGAQPVLAHGSTKPQHGGVVQMSGETLFELVNKPGEVAVYVTDDDEQVAAARMTAKMTVTSGGKSQSHTLKPAAGNRFDATGVTIPAGSEVAIQVINSDTQARMGTTFTVK